MKPVSLFLFMSFLCLISHGQSPEGSAFESSRFDIENDLLLLHYDCKTDVDDLHSAAAFVTLNGHRDYASLTFRAVAGTYGIQEGLYVPPESLFELAFGSNWSDAHANFELAADEVSLIAKRTLDLGGNVWIAEAGQSDFSAEVVKRLEVLLPDVKLKERIHVVQHSDWNEEVTSPEHLEFVRQNTSYHKIPDGNAIGNGTPGFRSPDYRIKKGEISDLHVKKVWKRALKTGEKYNARGGRYNNEAIAAGGLDFSDMSEVCWILGLEDIHDTREFFERFGK